MHWIRRFILFHNKHQANLTLWLRRGTGCVDCTIFTASLIHSSWDALFNRASKEAKPRCLGAVGAKVQIGEVLHGQLGDEHPDTIDCCESLEIIWAAKGQGCGFCLTNRLF